MTSSSSNGQAVSSNERLAAYGILFVMPLFFSSDIVFDRAAVSEVKPFTLAFLRWFLTSLLLLPFVLNSLRTHWRSLMQASRLLLLMGFLGMWVCGAMVYLTLKYTTATNGTLIYTSSPVLIILIEFAFKGRNIGLREAIGTLTAFAGVVVIVFRADFEAFRSLRFNAGDLIFVATAFSWAIYSVLLKSNRVGSLPTLPLFCALAFSGTLLLAPFAAFEVVALQAFSHTQTAWLNIAGIVGLASLLAFSSFQFGVKILGSLITGIFLYLLPICGVTLAVLFLGETFQKIPPLGNLLVLSGIVVATFPNRRRRA